MFTNTIKALRQQESNHWTIGDALVDEVRTGREWEKLVETLANEGLDYKPSTLKIYRRVAEGFPADKRRKGVSFAAHQAALTADTLAQAEQAIDQAERVAGRATRDSVLNQVRQIKGRTTNDTSDAVVAWRELRRGVAKLLDLDEAELEALLQIDSGNHAGEAADLSKNLTEVSMRISAALNKAEKQLARAKARKAKAEQATKPKAPAKAKAKTSEAPKRKPQVKRLGAGRGEG